MLGSSTQRSQRGSTPSFRVENCTTAGTRLCQASSGGGLPPPARPAPRCLYLRQQRWLLPVAPPSAGTRSPAPAPPAAACPGRTSRGTAGARRCPASARHRHAEDFRIGAQPPRPQRSETSPGGFIGARSCREPWPTPPPCPSPCSHQQQAVAVVEVKHQGFIQELVAGAHGVGTAVGATACPGVVCSHLTGAGGPAHTPGSAGPPKNQGEIEPGQCREPGSSPSSPPAAGATLGSFCRTYSNTATQDWTKESVPGSQGTQVSMETWGVPSRARSFSFMSWDCPQLR